MALAQVYDTARHDWRRVNPASFDLAVRLLTVHCGRRLVSLFDDKRLHARETGEERECKAPAFSCRRRQSLSEEETEERVTCSKNLTQVSD